MNKKGFAIVASFIILIILGWFIYRAIKTPETEVVTESETKVHTLDSKIPSTLKTTETIKAEQKKAIENGAIIPNKKLQDKAEDNFEAFEKLEKAWLSKAQSIMGPEKYELYVDMRNRNDKEKMQAYKEYHDYLRQKFGDKFSYNISEDQSVREKQINQRYLKELLKLIGAEKFKAYTASKDQFNEEMRRKNIEAIQIEF